VEPSGRTAPPRKLGVLCVPGVRFNPSDRLISELTFRNRVGAERDGGKSSPPQHGVRYWCDDESLFVNENENVSEWWWWLRWERVYSRSPLCVSSLGSVSNASSSSPDSYSDSSSLSYLPLIFLGVEVDTSVAPNTLLNNDERFFGAIIAVLLVLKIEATELNTVDMINITNII